MNKPMGRPKLPEERVRKRVVCHLKKSERDYLDSMITKGRYKSRSEMIEIGLMLLRRENQCQL